MKEINVYSDEKPRPFPREDDNQTAKYIYEI